MMISTCWSSPTYLQNHYPVSTFWPRQAFETSWLLAACALLLAGTRWLVRRHAA